jgi:hypothetical protein
MPVNPQTFQDVYDALVEEHGCTSVAHLAVCRSLATLLIDDNPDNPLDNARTANSLAGLLPPRKPVGKVDKIIVEYVRPSNPEMVESITTRSNRLQEENQRLQRRIYELECLLRGGDKPVSNPMIPLPDSGNGSDEGQRSAAPINESTQDRKQRLERYFGAHLHSGLSNYPIPPDTTENPQSRSGFERFDNKLR